MDPSEFETALRRDGYAEVLTGSQRPHHATTPHAHDFDVRALVLDGEITLTVAGVATRYAAGETFSMARGCEHTETVGQDGVRTLAGRRRLPAEASTSAP